MSNTKNILILPGDGIGPEVCKQAKRVLDFFSNNGDTKFICKEALIGGIAIDQEGKPLSEATINLALASDAVLLGAVGGPKWESMPYEIRPERGLLGIRKSLELFANLRPAICFDELVTSSTLKEDVVSGLDIMIVRELTGGIYFGQPRGVEIDKNGNRKGFNTLVYHDYEIQRVAKVAFDIAKKRNGRVCSVDKANVLESTELWREEISKLQESNYQDIELSHMYVDNASMQLVRNPKQFDVIVTTNMFGDILSDTASMLTGSLGMLPSASLGNEVDGKINALYEPVHGSAPDIAGQNLANPIATILSVAMMFKYSFDMQNEHDKINNAIKKVLSKGYRTKDIATEADKLVSTEEMGDLIINEL
ncbi:MAG: 3-isopropylmalate dehydrogenase [Rickettsiales bacterium]|nr:3-isopropylmalate dehydrogenase [Rickettsiales bacterium]